MEFGFSKSIVIEGLVVANSNFTIRIESPGISEVLVSGIEGRPGEELVLSLDYQVVTGGDGGVASAMSLILGDFALDGYNEVLRCVTDLSE